MDLLPEIKDGKLVLNKEEKQVIRRAPVMTERKRMLKEAFARIRNEKYKRGLIEKVDSDLSELNNMGHNEVTEDFEDSPFADREPLEKEEDENSD
jgi:hypothetical protein